MRKVLNAFLGLVCLIAYVLFRLLFVVMSVVAMVTILYLSFDMLRCMYLNSITNIMWDSIGSCAGVAYLYLTARLGIGFKEILDFNAGVYKLLNKKSTEGAGRVGESGVFKNE